MSSNHVPVSLSEIESREKTNRESRFPVKRLLDEIRGLINNSEGVEKAEYVLLYEQVERIELWIEDRGCFLKNQSAKLLQPGGVGNT